MPVSVFTVNKELSSSTKGWFGTFVTYRIALLTGCIPTDQDGGSVIGSQDSVVTTETKLNPAVPVRTHTQAIARSSLSAAPASTTNLTDSLTQPHR